MTALRASSLTIPWSQPNLLNFLRRSHGQPRFYWESRRAAVSLAGFGATAVFRAHGADRFASIRNQVSAFWNGLEQQDENSLPPGLPLPAIFGGFSFQSQPNVGSISPSGIWDAFGEAAFFVPRYQVTCFGSQCWLTVTVNLDPEEAYTAQDALWELPGMFEAPPASMHLGRTDVRMLVGQKDWQRVIEQAREQIRTGRIKKVVASRALAFDSGADPLQALGRLSGRYPDCYRFLFEPAAGHAFFGASPELLAAVDGDRLHTMALAGSAPRGATMDEDRAFGRALMSSQKDLSEHQFVIQDIESSLSELKLQVDVGDTGLLQLSNIQHLHTPFSAGPLNGLDILDVLDALHPTPAVGGLPRRSAQAFIDEHETISRGWYAAPVGWLDGHGGGVFAVALRSAVTNGNTTRLYAGAGIVADSLPDLEWDETQLKFSPILEALR